MSKVVQMMDQALRQFQMKVLTLYVLLGLRNPGSHLKLLEISHFFEENLASKINLDLDHLLYVVIQFKLM